MSPQYKLNGTANTLIPIFMNILSITWAVNPKCNYYKNLDVGQKFPVYNQQYPNNYSAGYNCNWQVQSPIGSKIIISCENINLPSTVECSGDKLKISPTGDTSFRDSRNYCGSGKISLVAQANRVAIEIAAQVFSRGGRFICTLTAVKDNKPEPEPPSLTNCDCGWKRGTKIVGGENTLVNEYPSMAGLVDVENQEIICGGSIISNRYILTAAHCMRNIPFRTMAILVGDWNITTGMDTNAAALYRTENYWEHPNFDIATGQNDVAIIRTLQPMAFSLLVGPVCLPFLYSDKTFERENVTILGWGQVIFNGPSSDVLQKVQVGVIPNSRCQGSFRNSSVFNSQICTLTAGKDSCQMDSGGPLLWLDPSTLRLQLVGVVSLGYGCATNRPSINSRVTSFLEWIVTVASDTNYCIK
uniref:Venom serine protease-like isoform X1 n=1 Tax=Diabrotica virgifera virgifera TaxID=50390 RepID=A0A6P7FK98_DIAVI